MTEHFKTAISFDLDGVVFKRLPIQAGATKKFLLHGKKIYKPFDLPQPIIRRIMDEPIDSVNEFMRYYYVQKSKLIKNVRTFIEREAQKADLYLNTGRPAKRNWVEMTMKCLSGKGIDERYFKGVFFKPEGMQSKTSKALAIKELIDMGYENITHYDDNPEDVLPLATMFPEVSFVIVQDLSTGMLFSRKEAEKYPNVRRIACF